MALFSFKKRTHINMEKQLNKDRYWFIELLSYWEGRINASSLKKQFNLSRQQSSLILNTYLESAPDNLVYDSSSKAYLAAKNFHCKYISKDVSEYLAWLQNEALMVMDNNNSPCFVLSAPSRQVSAEVIRGIIEAIRGQKRIEVDYVSLTNPNREGRIIAPHSFVNTGVRWHLRAWCEKSSEYRDFVLSRFRGGVEVLGKSTHTQAEDMAWNTKTDLIFEPDTRLPQEKKEVIEKDYQMINGQLVISTKACLASYLLRELQVNIKMLDGVPEAQQLVLVNLSDIQPWLF